jgi:tetratricopeptide (TPR) repeat protein
LANAIGPTVGSVPAEHERRLMFQSVSRYLRNVASPAGVLLVLDDLQWAGTDAFDLLAVLVRSADDIPLRVLCAYRSTEVEPGDPLAGFLADLVRPDLAKHLSLAPLSAVESTQLLAGLLAGVDGVDEAVEERIVQRAGGVPFFVVSCAEAMRSGSLADEVPWDLAQAVRQRVAALPPAAQGVLCAAAVGGRVVPRSLLAAVCDGPEDAILAGLDAACSAGLLTYTPSHLFQFAHDVIREALETSTAPGQRILLHRRVAEWLESLPQGTRRTAEIAWHFQQSGDLERALPYALLAGDQAAAAFAHGDAEKHYRTVIELAGDPTVSAQRGQVVKTEALEKLGATLATMARLEEALESLERAARMNRARGDFEREGQVVARIGHAHFLRGSEQEGIARLRPVLDSLAQCGPSSGLARLYVAHARLIHGLCRPEEQLAAATKGVAVARAIGDDETLAMASRLRGQALLDLRRLHEALETYSEVLPLLEEARNLAGLCSALVDTAYVHDALGEFDEARPHLHRALHIAREMEDPLSISSVLEALAWNLLLVGRWAEARSRTEEMESILGPLEVSRRSGHPLFLRVELALRGGRREDARQYLKEGLVQHGKVYLIAKSVQFALARLDLLEGRPEAALPVLRAQVEEREPNPDLTLLPYLAEAYLGVGDVARADIRLMRATEWSRAAQARRTLIEALRVRGLFLIHEARRPEARDSLEEALSLTRSIGVPWEEGRLLVLLGELHARAGDAGPARERWEQAHAIFERLGAGKLAEETQRTLARFR